MKKRFLAISLPMAISTAMFTTALPIKNSYASDLEFVEQTPIPPFQTSLMKLPVTMELPDELRSNFHKTLDILEEHLTLERVDFNGPKGEYWIESDGKLKFDIGRNSHASGERNALPSLERLLNEEFNKRNSFVRKFIKYIKETVDLSLIFAVNKRYENRKYEFSRPQPIEESLDGVYLNLMQGIPYFIEENSTYTSSVTPQTNTKKNVDLMRLVAAKLDESSYNEDVQLSIQANPMRQIAFDAVWNNIIIKERGIEADFPSTIAEDRVKLFQALVGKARHFAERYLLDEGESNSKNGVNTHFAETTTLLEEQAIWFTAQSVYGDSQSKRNRPLLAMNIPAVKNLVYAKVRLNTTIDFNDEEIKRFLISKKREKAEVIKKAKLRLLTENRNKARQTASVNFNDEEADKYIVSVEEEDKQIVVDIAKERIRLSEEIEVEEEGEVKE